MSPTTQGERAQGASAGARASQSTLVVHPATGEVLDELASQPPEVLADAYLAVKDELARLEAIRRALRAELQQRLTIRGVARMTVGDYEVGQSHGRRSVWDGDELEHVVRDLLDAGAITHRDIDGLIKHETKVDGRRANSLSSRLVGPHKAAVENCRTWEKDVRGFDVVASLPLVADE